MEGEALVGIQNTVLCNSNEMHLMKRRVVHDGIKFKCSKFLFQESSFRFRFKGRRFESRFGGKSAIMQISVINSGIAEIKLECIFYSFQKYLLYVYIRLQL